jgi:hypothetical protein
MTFTLLSRILPGDVARIIFDYVKLEKTQKIYWKELYSPASLIVNKLVKRYSDYSIVFNSKNELYDDLMIITNITNRLSSKGLIQKNIYIPMDEYIDNLRTLKKHLKFHFKDTKHMSYALEPLFIWGKYMIEHLDEYIN